MVERYQVRSPVTDIPYPKKPTEKVYADRWQADKEVAKLHRRHPLAQRYLPIAVETGFIVKRAYTFDEAIEESHRQTEEKGENRYVLKVPGNVWHPDKCYTVMDVDNLSTLFPHLQNRLMIHDPRQLVSTMVKICYASVVAW